MVKELRLFFFVFLVVYDIIIKGELYEL